MSSKYGEKLDKFYKSARWKRCRNDFFMRKKAQCEICGKAGYIVHHIIELDDQNVDDPFISLNQDNLMVVCSSCHNILHGIVDGNVEGKKPTMVVFDQKTGEAKVIDLSKYKTKEARMRRAIEERKLKDDYH